MGDWLKVYGETIYGTRKSFMQPADWGVAVEKGDKIYLHITNPELIGNQIEIKDFPYHLADASNFISGEKLKPVKKIGYQSRNFKFKYVGN